MAHLGDEDQSWKPGELKIDLSGARVTHSNLGNAGPDEGAEGMLLSNAGRTAAGDVLQLRLTADDHYRAFDPTLNGAAHGFGMLHLKSGTIERGCCGSRWDCRLLLDRMLHLGGSENRE